MPIEDGKYVMKITTTYPSVEKGIAEIEKKLKRARKIRISNIPMDLLEKLSTKLKGKDLKVILPEGEEPTDELSALGPMATTKGRMYVDWMGTEAEAGNITLPDIIFNVYWTHKDGTIVVGAMHYKKCAKCLRGAFDGGWHYAKKF